MMDYTCAVVVRDINLRDLMMNTLGTLIPKIRYFNGICDFSNRSKRRFDLTIVNCEQKEDYDCFKDLANSLGEEQAVLLIGDQIRKTDYASSNIEVLDASIDSRDFIVHVCQKLMEVKLSRNNKWDDLHKPIFIKGESSYFRLNVPNVSFIEAHGNYVKIHLSNGKWILGNCSIKSIQRELPRGIFCRVHRSFIVSMDKVDNFTAQNLQIAGSIIPLGRNYKSKFEERMVKV
jgi:DNA-binding LytR/AlgR family response regulator